MSKKKPFENLGEEFMTKVDNSSDEEIRTLVSKIALAEHENRQAMAADQDLAEKKEIVKEAAAQYTESTKRNRAAIAYCHFILEARGKA